MVTQAQIAEKLGISRPLVTFALADYPQVSKTTRERVLKAAREMGYRPNPHARALRLKKTGIIALWIPDQISTHYSRVARAMARIVKKEGNELIISEIGDSKQELLSHVPVDAIFAVDASKAVQTELKSKFRSASPIVSLGASKTPDVDSVEVDMAAGTADVMRHLIDSGYRRIAHATFVDHRTKRANRRNGYTKSMREAGLKPEFIQYPLSLEQRPVVRRLIQEYIEKKGTPEAIFCHSDDVALGIYPACATPASACRTTSHWSAATASKTPNTSNARSPPSRNPSPKCAPPPGNSSNNAWPIPSSRSNTHCSPRR